MEIMKSIVEASLGPHAFIIVVKIGRMSKADTELLQMLPQLFGSNAPQYATVLFTHGDELRHQSIEQKIQSSSCVSELVSMCSGRYCVFDNKVRKSRRQVQNFMNKVDEIVTANSGKHCSSDMFRMAEMFINEAERSRQAGTDETPRGTTQRRLNPNLAWIWRNIWKMFTA
ncbi:hypothetical protein L3Q82_006662 [Scortum barcoo]|uniref:Uncharacterized protein n=1 Tax=Scortum barcoo TaxID=214431 RepID=A0ACB8X0R3_9TELE|nr:hypothetical protein L3Q82_006662 [Scortum barcoo]